MTPPADDTLVLPASTTVKVANKLLDILNTTLGDLSEPELLVVRSDLKDSLLLTDRLLSDMEIVSALESFSMADDPAVSSNETSASATSTRAADPNPTQEAATRTTVLTTPSLSPTKIKINQGAASGDASNETPQKITTADGREIITVDMREIILSVRPNVGIPNYEHHPLFVRPGIPGPYSRPPIGETDRTPSLWYIVTKGLYVGIFTNWNETSSYVLGVSRNAHCSTSRWEEAMDRYNSTLAVDACQVLR